MTGSSSDVVAPADGAAAEAPFPADVSCASIDVSANWALPF